MVSFVHSDLTLIKFRFRNFEHLGDSHQIRGFLDALRMMSIDKVSLVFTNIVMSRAQLEYISGVPVLNHHMRFIPGSCSYEEFLALTRLADNSFQAWKEFVEVFIRDPSRVSPGICAVRGREPVPSADLRGNSASRAAVEPGNPPLRRSPRLQQIVKRSVSRQDGVNSVQPKRQKTNLTKV